MTREESIAILDGFKHNPLFNEQHFEALDMAISALSEKRPKGEWLLIGHDDTCNFYKCSFCGYEEHDNFTKHHNFCPNCGADMRGE